MLSILAAVASGALCLVEQVAGSPGENHVMFHGLSRDGRSLAVGWDRGTAPNVERGAYLLDLKTGKHKALPHLNNAPSISPNGGFLVSANYSGDRALKTEVVELDRRANTARSFASGPSAEWLASYSADGKWILFNSTRSGTSDIYRVRRLDGHLEQLTSDSRYEAHASFFDGGRQIVFHRQINGNDYDIVVRNLGTGSERTVGATAAEEAYPAVSPDGNWITFSAVSSAGSQPNLYVMRSDGTHRVRLTQGAAKDAYATWSPDGRTIYFVRFEAAGSKIMRMRVKNGRCV